MRLREEVQVRWDTTDMSWTFLEPRRTGEFVAPHWRAWLWGHWFVWCHPRGRVTIEPLRPFRVVAAKGGHEAS